MINTLFFDLDGTLLHMDQDLFIKDYFKRLVKALAQTGLEPELGIKAVGYGTQLMLGNTGPTLNEDLFWKGFTQISSIQKENISDLIDTFYLTDFQKVSQSTQAILGIKDVISDIKDKGYKLVLATNPLFPQAATHSRVRWANLDIDMFEEITTFENYHASKPSLEYYQEIMDKVGVSPTEVLMVGNDVKEDLAIRHLGSKTYLVTDNLINRENQEIVSDHVGSMDEFRNFAKKLPNINVY